MSNTVLIPHDETTEVRFERYLASYANVLGHDDRIAPFHSYCTGLTLPGDRKSVEPMAAMLAADSVSTTHKVLHHFVAKAPWSDVAIRDAAVRGRALLLHRG